MASTRLTQIGVGGAAYDADTVVSASLAEWQWQAFPATILYYSEITRLGQFGVGLADYPVLSLQINIECTLAEWQWQSYPATIEKTDTIPVDCQLAEWQWQAYPAQVCGPSRYGYPYAFNEAVFPHCAWNEEVFGERDLYNIYGEVGQWQWQAYPAVVDYQADIPVNCTLANWEWQAFPANVSLGLNVNCALAAWTWEAYPATVTFAIDVECSLAEWQWQAFPANVSLGVNINCALAAWTWEAYPATIVVPKFDVDCRLAEWGWTTYPADVDYTQLSQEDIEAIWQKFVDEGAVEQWLETWMRQGCHPSYPQDIPVSPGKHIEVGGMRIYVERLPDGTIRHTRE